MPKPAFVLRRPWPVLVSALLLVACGSDSSNPAPPKVTTPPAFPIRSSAIAVPISARLIDLERLVNRDVPVNVVSINEARKACARLPAIGDVSCRLVGQATRGPITIRGKGDVLTITMPIAATVSAKDIGRIIKSETATAAAVVTARVRLLGVNDWLPVTDIKIDYRWTKQPGIDFLGRRIKFTGRADPELAKVIAKLEASVPKHIASLHPRQRLDAAWRQGFTSISLNERNPPVWMRITPQELRFRNYQIENGVITLALGATANTETFVGQRPADPPITPLPPPAPRPVAPQRGFVFHVPVTADYAELEPVLEKALRKLSSKPLTVPVIGTVKPEFGDVTMYATSDGRLAIGLAMRVEMQDQWFSWLNPSGTVWLTGQPYNEPGQQLVKVRDLQIAGRPDSAGFRVLLAVAQSPAVSAALADALSQNFARDYDRILEAAGKAIAEKRLGQFVLLATIDEVKNGVIYPSGSGLFMAVDAMGTAGLRYEPRKDPPRG